MATQARTRESLLFRWARYAARNHWRVLAGWLVILIVAIAAAWPFLPVVVAPARPVKLRPILTGSVEAARRAIATIGTIIAGPRKARTLGVAPIVTWLVEISRLAARPIIAAGVIPAPRVALLPRLVVAAVAPAEFAVTEILARSARTTIRRSA